MTNTEASPRNVDGALIYPADPYRASREREQASRQAWIERVTEWLDTEIVHAELGIPTFRPLAPEGTPEGWRWTGWRAMTEREVLNAALVRSYGCTCPLPLIGHRPNGTPRCRLCNTDEHGTAR